jgi:hypothetical protein
MCCVTGNTVCPIEYNIHQITIEYGDDMKVFFSELQRIEAESNLASKHSQLYGTQNTKNSAKKQCFSRMADLPTSF